MKPVSMRQVYQLLLPLLLMSQRNCGYATSADTETVCPQPCVCTSDQPEQTVIQCTIFTSQDWEVTCSRLNNHTDLPEKIHLKVQGHSHSFSDQLSCLPKLESLDVSGTGFEMEKNMFHGVDIVSSLNISYNGIKSLPQGVFAGLGQVSHIDLSHNYLSELESDLFEEIASLRSLDISYNRLDSPALDFLLKIPNLEQLNLEYNRLWGFLTMYLPTNITSINLQGNLLSGMCVAESEHFFYFEKLQYLDISDNPLVCSCQLQKLLLTLPNWKTVVRNPLKTICNSPQVLHGQNIQGLMVDDLPCSAPSNLISYPTNEKNVLGFSSITLECQAEGYPKPSVMWITPWNDVFFNATHQVSEGFQSVSTQEFSVFKEYEEPNVFFVSSLRLTSNDELSITHFRGSMAGNFTCVAINAAGNTSVDIILTAYSKMKEVYVQSLFMGGYCASGLLIFGFFVGFVKMVVVRLRHLLCFSVPIFSKSPSTQKGNDNISATLSLEVSDSKPDWDGKSSRNSEPSSPLIAYENSFGNFQAQDSNEDPEDGDYCASKRQHHSIFESIEEAKGRLRFGVGRKMERMRKNVQSIKESSSVYMHSIVETGSSAASRMKAGVALGVETVKSHVQSFKELCGTGDMGTQTISMISVETNVDSHQQKEVVKQMTFV